MDGTSSADFEPSGEWERAGFIGSAVAAEIVTVDITGAWWVKGR
jgi:hypothetical protein